MERKHFPSVEGVTPKTWRDYDPSKLGHVGRNGSSPVQCETLRKGDVLVMTESGVMDLVEVIENDAEKSKLYVVYHTSWGKMTGKLTPFTYDYGSDDGMGRGLIGQWPRIFEIGLIPERYLNQAFATEEFLPQENYV